MASKYDIYQKALEILTRREHSFAQVHIKLSTKFSENTKEDIDDVLEELIQKDLLSDQRFAEAILSYRSQRGYGPNWIRSYLRGQGVSSIIVDDVFISSDINWVNIAKKAKLKKFGADNPTDHLKKMKEFKFLQNRGFTQDQVNLIYTE